MRSAKSYYSVLGVLPDVPADVIRAAYLAHAKRHHPDTGGESVDEEILKELNEAYECLSDPDRRSMYDRQVMQYRKVSESDYGENSFAENQHSSSYNPWRGFVFGLMPFLRWGWFPIFLLLLFSWTIGGDGKLPFDDLAIKNLSDSKICLLAYNTRTPDARWEIGEDVQHYVKEAIRRDFAPIDCGKLLDRG
jgi:curved DNA-binding protein CbpA